MVLNVINTLLAPVQQFNPALVIFVISFIMSVVTVVVNKKFMETKQAKEITEKMKKMQEESKSADLTSTKKLGDQTKNFLKLQSDYMRLSMKPLLISIILAILILPWLQATYKGAVVATMPDIIPFISGWELSWLWWYIICSLAISVVIRKLLE